MKDPPTTIFPIVSILRNDHWCSVPILWQPGNYVEFSRTFVLLLCCFRGGVLTPGAAFAETSLIDRLESHGLRFSTIEK